MGTLNQRIIVYLSHLRIQHDFGCSVPSCGYVFGEKPCVIVIRICDAGQTKVTDLKITSRVQQEIRRLQIAVQHVGGVDVFKASQNLVEEVANVIVAQTLEQEKIY